MKNRKIMKNIILSILSCLAIITFLVSRQDGHLCYYQHNGVNNGTASWGKGTGNKVGASWSGLTTAFGMGSWVNKFSASMSDKIKVVDRQF